MNIFIAFANQDRDVRDKLLRQMNLVSSKQSWNIWSSKEIKAGEKWDTEIQQRLLDSEVVILLLSTDFFNSKYIIQTELPAIIAKHRSGGCQIIPVIARACHWKETDFGEYVQLGDIQALPVGEQPLISRSHWDNEDQAYFEAVQGIREAIQTFQTRRRREAEVTERKQREAEQRNREEQARQERETIARAKYERLTQHRREQEAKARLTENIAWQQTIEAGQVAGYEDYLAHYPQGEHATDARTRIKQLKRKGFTSFFRRHYAIIASGLLLLLAIWIPKIFSEGKKTREDVIKKSGLEMVNIQGGTFTMGSPITEEDRFYNECQHTVTVN